MIERGKPIRNIALIVGGLSLWYMLFLFIQPILQCNSFCIPVILVLVCSVIIQFK